METLKCGQTDRDCENANLSEQIYEQECEIRRGRNENENLRKSRENLLCENQKMGRDFLKVKGERVEGKWEGEFRALKKSFEEVLQRSVEGKQENGVLKNNLESLQSDHEFIMSDLEISKETLREVQESYEKLKRQYGDVVKTNKGWEGESSGVHAELESCYKNIETLTQEVEN